MWRFTPYPRSSIREGGALKIRMALDGEGERIRDLIKPVVDLDWSHVYPHWLVCEMDGIVGCLNVLPSKPIGVLDQLGIDPSLGNHARAKVARALILQGMSTLKKGGAQVSISLIPFDLKSYKRLLKKHFGAEVMGQGNILMARL